MTNFKKMLLGYYIVIKKSRLPQAQHFKWDKEKLIYPFRLLVHPIDVFSDLKFEGKSSLLLANVIMLLYVFQQMLTESSTAYLFRPGSDGISIQFLLARTIGAALLWTVCNWAMCTLADGEGKMREIWIAVCYSLLPAILFGFIQLLMSHVLSSDEGVMYVFLQSFSTGWTLLLIFLGMMITHQYSVSKTVLSVIYTLVCIMLTLFLLFLFISISQQLYGFISGLVQELSYR